MKKIKKFNGFSLLEVIVSTFVFVIVIVSVAQIFGSGHLGFKKNRALQRDLETAQQAINILAKTLRTSEVVSPSSIGSFNQIKIFDYSRTGGECIFYQFGVGGESGLLVGYDNSNSRADCANANISSSSYKKITSGTVYGNFYVIPGDNNRNPKEMGRVTISMRVCLKGGCGATSNPKNEVRIQTTVSLRNNPSN